MKVRKARSLGFCGGVKRAIKLVSAEAERRGEKIYTLGSTVHNPQVTEELAQKGVLVVDGLDAVPGSVVSITAHGAPPWVAQQARERGHEVVDATCPLVTRIHEAARTLHEEGYFVIVYGNARHPEVRGIVGWTNNRAAVFEPGMDVESWTPPWGSKTQVKVGIVVQSTQEVGRFQEFVAAIARRFLGQLKELRVHNTICAPTMLRQEAVAELAPQVDAMVVIGGRNSANTRHLYEICQAASSRAFWIESPSELRREWFDGVETVGVTAGASTPDHVVDEVVRLLEEF